MEHIKVVPNIDRVIAAGGQPSEHIPTQQEADAALRMTDVELLGVPNGTSRDEPVVMIIGRVEGAPAPIIIETTLALLETCVSGIRAGCS